MQNTKLYVARRENRLRQKDLAKKLGISSQSYFRKESGKTAFTQHEMVMLAKIFNCTLNDLFWEESVEENKEKEVEMSPETQQRVFEFFMKTSAPRLYEEMQRKLKEDLN